MGTGDLVTCTLRGGAPWGFRLQGGIPYPLIVSKIRKKSKAHAQGMKEGDLVVSINGVPVTGRSHDEAMRMVDQSGDLLAIQLNRGNMPDVMTVPGSMGAVINGHSNVEQEGPRVTNTTRADYDDGRTKGFVETQTFSEKEDGREMRGFVQTQSMTSDWTPTQAPLPSLLDKSLSHQPYSSQPVQVQVSAMFSDGESGVSTPQGRSSPSNSMFNVRKVTQSSTTTSTQKDTWKPSFTPSMGSSPTSTYNPVTNTMPASSPTSTYNPVTCQIPKDYYQPIKPPQPQFGDEKDYPMFSVPAINKITAMKQKQPPPPPAPKPAPKVAPKTAPKPVFKPTVTIPQQQTNFNRVRDIKLELMSPRSYDDDVDSIMSPSQEHLHKHGHHLPVFAPPVQISLHAGERDDLSHSPSDLGLSRTDSVESEISSLMSSQDGRKVYADSAFYDDPTKNYPTIKDQMKLCKIIAHSLTSAANRKARGAKMFAKRQKKSDRWIHDGHLNTMALTDDIPGYNPHYYDEEEDDRFQLSFKIPNVKHRVGSPDRDSKMSLTQTEFERLRLEADRCDHQTVSPNQCFDIAQSLKNNKGRAGKLFEKRRQRSEKYVVDETNAQRAPMRPGGMLGGGKRPLKGGLSPWDAAMQDPCGSVERAFDELSEFERKQKLNQMLKLKPMAPPAPAPAVLRPQTPPMVIPSHMRTSNLRADPMNLLQGADFNRKARGWGAHSEPPSRPSHSPLPGPSSPLPMHSPTPQAYQQTPPQFGDYNPKIRAWQASGADYDGGQYQGYGYASDSSNMYSPSGYRNPWGQGGQASEMMPGSDL